MSALYNAYIRHRKKFFVIWTVLFSLYGFINFYFLFEVNYRPNDECLWQPAKDSTGTVIYKFQNVKVDGVAWNAGIRNGDILREINDKTFNTEYQANRILLDMEGTTANYTVERNGEIFHTRVEIKRLINFFALAFSIFAIIWLWVAFIVVLSKPQGETQVLFYRLGVAFVLYSGMSILLFDNGFNPLSEYPALFWFFDTTYTLGFAFLPALIMHFFWIFPKHYSFIDNQATKKILYSITALIFTLFTIGKTLVGHELTTEFVIYHSVTKLILAVILVIATIVSFIFLFKSFLSIKGKKERVPVFIILVAYLLAILAIVYTAFFANLFTNSVYNNPEYFMPVILIGILPISFGFAIFRYSLMDISDVLKNAVLYGLATIALAGLYFLIIYIIGTKVSGFFSTEYQSAIAAGMFILFAILFQSIKDKLQDIITRRFYPEQFAYQQVLMKFSNEVGSVFGLNNILDYTVNIFTDSLKLDKFAILLKEKNQYTFKIHNSVGVSSPEIIIKADKEKLESFISKRRSIKLPPVIDENITIDSIFGESATFIHQEKIYTILPLIIKEKIIGFLFFGLKYSGSKFAGSDVELLTAVSNQLATALENARLYESEAEKLKLFRDLENARSIQNSLLPQKLPDTKGFELAGEMIPAMHVGGDYFDIVKVSDTKFFVVIGDVSGKGLSASFYMSKLETMVKLFCTEKTTPKEVLSTINRNLTPELQANWFITVTVALFDSESKTVNICRAGHTPVLMVHNTSKIYYQPSGMGIGLDSGKLFDSSLEEFITHYEPGEIYTFYSDGISEGMNDRNEFYGDDQIRNVIVENHHHHPVYIKNKLLSDLDQFRAGFPQNDDLTIVIVKVKE